MNEYASLSAKPSLAVEGLSVERGGRLLFDALSFEASPGAMIEVRGPNGSGKTSLLRTIAGFSKPHAGRVAVSNYETRELALHFVGHRDGLKATVDAQAHLRYWAGLLGGGEGGVQFALQCLGLAPIALLPARVLSQGQARRVSLARLFVAPRPIWLLDEPAAALDAQGRVLLSELIASHRAGGGIVVAAVHESVSPGATRAITLGAT